MEEIGRGGIDGGEFVWNVVGASVLQAEYKIKKQDRDGVQILLQSLFCRWGGYNAICGKEGANCLNGDGK